MRVAVLSLTRDRLDYTKRNFALLRENAGCPFDLYVFDNGSIDGTGNWLMDEDDAGRLYARWSPDNIGICSALNRLLDSAGAENYDVVVRFDNDCEVRQPGTLKKVCEVALKYDMIVAPKVLGLRNPPAVREEIDVGGDTIEVTGILGGVFMAIPAHLFTDGFRYDEGSPLWGGDEYICSWWQERGGLCGYLKGWEVLHDTDQHHADHPEHFERRVLEGGPA